MQTKLKRMIVAWRQLLAGAALLAVLALGAASPATAQVERDPAKVVGPNACAECHKRETEVWKGTHHFSTFTQLPRAQKAGEIAKAMGLRRIKRGSLCLDCHFTTMIDDKAERAPVAGISCESCHGQGQAYLKIHSTFSGKKEETETDAEEAVRWRQAEAAGMIRPGLMYDWAKNCYSCHVVPQEKLVNTGGHPAGSKFELVAWSQGEVRHNLWYNGGKENAGADTNTQRKMFVIGMAIEVEISLRAVGEATEKADYAVAMAKRAQRAVRRFKQAAELLKVVEMDEIVAAAGTARLRLNNKAELSAAADKVADVARRIAANYDGSTFAAIDRALPKPGSYKGTVAQ